jgi:hypothetical protein
VEAVGIYRRARLARIRKLFLTIVLSGHSRRPALCTHLSGTSAHDLTGAPYTLLADVSGRHAQFID